MKIQTFADATRLSVHALRHYEAMGLLVPARLSNGWRDYAPAQVREGVFIAMSRDVGFSLAAIAQVLPLYRQGGLSVADMVEMLEKQQKVVDEQIATLSAQRQKLIDHAQWLNRQASGAPNRGSSRKPWPASRKKQR
ncbi:MerR family transcriptional regulator [Hydrogenophaga sp. 5NK40-0174]|uniref:MerR family transcriptional regulator n=1 Tax=Hydrogenophaga sp. 5NK40-0174 TaxID=3127649 RepID=UPI0031022D52